MRRGISLCQDARLCVELVLSGLSYDALHGVGNFAIMLVLYRPLRKALKAAKRQIGY